MNVKIDETFKIAVKELRSNYGKLGIYAGPNYHKEYWARDSFISSLGSLVIGDKEIVRNNLDLFIKYLRPDGHIPARIEDRYHSLKAIGLNIKRKKLAALHKQSQPWATDVVDSNSWFLIAAASYLDKIKYSDWLIANKDSLIKIGKWLIGRIRSNNLIYESYIANWSDNILKKGFTLYNNVLAWKALNWLAEVLDGEDKSLFEEKADKIKSAIINNFWNEKFGYFIDYIDIKNKKHTYFASDGNLLTIWFGLADKYKSRKILDFIKKNKLDRFPISVIYPKLDFWNDLFNKIVFPMYNTRNIFPLLSNIYGLAVLKSGDKKSSGKIIENISNKILEYKTCHEVFTPDGKPVNFWFYKSEHAISWTAAMFIYLIVNFRK